MKFILYARKSSEGDERQVQSIPDQHAVLRRLAEQQDLKIVQAIDEARSAKQPGSRPGFQQVLDILNAGDADAILCWHLNRLSRNPVDSGTLSWMLQQGAIKMIRTADREYLPDDNVVVMAVENAVSNQFIVDLRRNVKRGQREKAARGWFPHKPPPGYRTDPDSREIVPDGERFDLIRRAWELMLTRSYSVPEVQAKLEQWGYRHRRIGQFGNPINRTGLYSLFDNPFYYGEFLYAGQVYVGKHTPMVTRDEFEIVQSTIHKTAPFSSKKPEFPFTGLIRCGKCGCQITAEQKVKHYRLTNRTATYTYYHCTRKKGCKEPAVTGFRVESKIISILKKLETHKEFAQWLRELDFDSRATAHQDVGEKIAILRREIVQGESRRARLLELRIADEISSDEFADLSAQQKKAADDAKRTIERIESGPRDFEASKLSVASFVDSALKVFQASGPKIKREIATCLMSRATMTNGAIEIEVHPLLRPLMRLEPPKGPQNMVEGWPFMPFSPVWQGWMDDIRTLVTEEGIIFPPLSCLQSEPLHNGCENGSA